MVRKDFDVSLYNKYDKSARKHFIKFIKGIDKETVIENDPFGKYGIDLLIKTSSGNKILIDLEVRPIWLPYQSKFPFSTIHLPERKSKYLGYSLPTYFISFRKDYKAFVIISKKLLTNIIEVSNKYVKSGEKFFDVPVSKCKTVYIKY